jgi:hypothetical protein
MPHLDDVPMMGMVKTPLNAMHHKTQKDRKKEEKILVVFFRDRYFRFITMKYTRIVLIPVFIAIVSMFGYYASTLVPDNENVSKTIRA